MKARVIRILKKTAKIIVITILSLVLILFILPYILPNTISRKIKTLVNKSIEGEVNFSKARLSFFNHFPALTLTLDDFTLTGSAPFESDTLLSAGEVAFGIDLFPLLRGDITVDQFFIERADIHVKVNEEGEANYNVYKSGGTSNDTVSSAAADTTAALRIERIVIRKSDIVYDDKSSGVFIRANGLNYTGKGDLSKAIFDLSSHLAIDSFDFYYDQDPYVLRKKINADLITQVNTNSLALVFEKNKLQINRLPLEFVGKFDFLSDGYYMDFRVKSVDARLRSVFTVLPPSYNGWLKKTKMKGDANLEASLIGSYVTATGAMPDFNLAMQVREGSIDYADAPVPLSNLYLDLRTTLPGLNVDSLALDVDSLFFNVDKDRFSSVLHVKGFEAPHVFTRTQCNLDLEKLDKAIGLEAVDLKGKLSLQLYVNGQYREGQDPKRIRKANIITSIPSFTLDGSLTNGYFHYTSLPQAIQQCSFKVVAGCPDNNYRNASFAIENIDMKALDNYMRGFIRLKNGEEVGVDANLDAVVRLSDIQKFYPLDSLDINGDLVVKMASAGNYQPDKKLFPKTSVSLNVADASIKTNYYPSPIEKIQVDAEITNKAGTFYDMDIAVKPISFQFEGKPFTIEADLRNLDNIQYNIISKGELDLGRIYRVFAQDGLNVKGWIETDLSLKGNQADAAAGRLSRLNNSGTLRIKDISLYSDFYPLPFIVDKGAFRFRQDQMRFEEFRARYGSSAVMMNGYVTNFFNYVAGSGALKGELRLQSDRLLLDELMAYRADSTAVLPDSVAAGSSGVVIIPTDLDLKLIADVKSAVYNNLDVTDIKGEVTVSEGEVKLNQTGFTLAGASTVMDASYKSLSPSRAFFTYHITADEFDVKRMYDEVEMFRELAPAAAKAQGVISLDYYLEGKLDDNMYPVMPSLKGGGVLSVKKVKVKGLRFFSAIGKETGKNEIKDPDLSKIDFKTTIKNNVVTLERTKIKVAGFRLRVQGQTSLDGKIKFKCRLGLPPFGIIGIPMNITGTGDNPRIKLGKGDELPLEEQQEEMEDN